MSTAIFAPGGYRFIPAVFQYSGGVAAEPGFEITRVRFQEPVALADGFARIEQVLRAAGRPLTSFCACELRSGAPFTEDGFRAFNEIYAGTLEKWGLFDGRTNPVARSNVCPQIDPPSVPSFHAFCYTVPSQSDRGGFVVAGSAEAQEGKGPYRERTVRYGETSPDAVREKMRFVVGVMEARLRALGYGWQDAVSTHAYTVLDIGALIGEEIAARGIRGLTWHHCHPPVEGLAYEMDVKGARREIIVA